MYKAIVPVQWEVLADRLVHDPVHTSQASCPRQHGGKSDGPFFTDPTASLIIPSDGILGSAETGLCNILLKSWQCYFILTM